MPDFGHAQRPLWPLDPDLVYLNHGTVGSAPRAVLAAQQAIRDEIERNPSRFLLRELTGIRVGGPRRDPPRLDAAAAVVARFVGAGAGDLVFVDNATTGVNAVLRSFDFRPGDEILITDLTYGAVANAALHVARDRGATVRAAVTPWPATPESMVAAIAGAVGPKTRLAIVDHVSSESALLMPIASLVRSIRSRGVAVLVDGAHAPGALPLELAALGADWYTGNLHKWAWSPRSSGILWAHPKRQLALQPLVTSWGYEMTMSQAFHLPGTRDPSAHLAAPAAIAALEAAGLDAVRHWNHTLAWDAARLLATAWETPFETPESMIGCMATVPLPEAYGGTREDAATLRDALLFDDGIEVQLHAWRERLWVRISAQIYNELADYERLASAVLARRPSRASR